MKSGRLFTSPAFLTVENSKYFVSIWCMLFCVNLVKVKVHAKRKITVQRTKRARQTSVSAIFLLNKITALIF